MADEHDQVAHDEGPIKAGKLPRAAPLNAEIKRLQHQIDDLRQRLEALEGRQAQAGEGGERELM